jgi:putative transposase
MPRIPRGQQAGFVYHVIILALAKARHPVKMFGFSLMPNHFHFVIESSHQQSLTRFMQWLLTSHVRR